MPERFVEGLNLLQLQLPQRVIEKELLFLDELLRWNQKINLTSIRDRNDAIEIHLLDSLVMMRYLSGCERVLDIGSGGGLPGIPLAIAMPGICVDSIDSVGKKVNFQKHIKRLLQLDNLKIQQTRVEDLRPKKLNAEKFDLVIIRALAPLSILLEYAAPWVKTGGRLLAMKGPEGRAELEAAELPISQLHFHDPTIEEYRLPFTHAARQLIIINRY